MDIPGSHLFSPNQYTLPQPDGIYGLHRFKDGVLMLVKQHSCGEWQTIRPATPEEESHFVKFGTPAVKGQATREGGINDQ
jgi:hypothetical protein